MGDVARMSSNVVISALGGTLGEACPRCWESYSCSIVFFSLLSLADGPRQQGVFEKRRSAGQIWSSGQASGRSVSSAAVASSLDHSLTTFSTKFAQTRQ